MPITATHLTAGQGGGEQLATASITPGGNNLILLSLGIYKSTTGIVEPTTVSGNGITYAKIGACTDFDDGFGPKRIVLYRGLSASPSAGAITGSGATWNNHAWAVTEVSSVDDSGGSNGSAATVQFGTNQSAVDETSISITLSAFGSTNNGAFGTGYSYNNINMVPEGGWTELVDDFALDGVQTMWRNDNDTTPSWTFASDRVGVVAIEIKFGAPPPNVVETSFSRGALTVDLAGNPLIRFFA